ncbi:MAG: hypothetical protein Fur0041_14060 [Bacteroidia bacterium]
MIIYRSIKAGFQDDVDLGKIDQIIEAEFQKKLHRKTSGKEVESWWNSLRYMSGILNDKEIPDDTGVAIEC